MALLHEAGKLVLIEGVETEHEAQMALACDADFVQGFFFGRPNPGAADAAHATTCISELTERYRDQAEARERRNASRLAPYLRAFERAAERLAAGEPLEEVCWNFLALDHAARCFLLDAKGKQAGRNVVLRADRAAHETRFLPLADAQGRELAASSVFPRGDQCAGTRACDASVSVDQRGVAVRDAVGGDARRRADLRAVRRY